MIQMVHVYISVYSHTLIERPYLTGHSEKSSLTVFHEAPFLGRVVAQSVKLVSLNGKTELS